MCPTRGSNNLSLSSFLWLDVIVDQLHLLENLSTNLSWSLSTNLTSSKLCVEIQDEKYHPCPSMNCVIIDNILASPQHKLVHVLCYTLRSLLSSICSSLPWSITILYVKNVLRIAPPLKNSWYSDTSHHHHSFLVLMLIRSVLFGLCTSSNPIALKLMIDSSF